MRGTPRLPRADSAGSDPSVPLDAFCTARDWAKAADVIRDSGGVLLGDAAGRLARERLERYRDRMFETVPHRLTVLLRCREKPYAEVLLPLVATEVLGPYAQIVLPAPGRRPDPDEHDAACTAALALPAADRPDVRALVLFYRAIGRVQRGTRQRDLPGLVADLAAAQQVLTAAEYPGLWVDVTQALGECLRRMEVGDRAANLERAIAELEVLSDHLRGTGGIPEANALNSLGDAYARRVAGGDRKRAAAALEESFRIFGAAGGVHYQGSVARNLATLAVTDDDRAPHERIAGAFRWSQTAEECFAARGMTLEVARTRADLGGACALYAEREDVPAFHRHAIDLIQASYEVDWSGLDRRDYAMSRTNLAACLLQEARTAADQEEAIGHFTVALDYLDPSDASGRAIVLNNRGFTLLEQDRLEEAAADLLQAAAMVAMELDQAVRAEQELAVVGRLDELHGGAALVLTRLGRYQEALDVAEWGRGRLLARTLGLSATGAAPVAAIDGVTLVVPIITRTGSVVLVVPPGTTELTERNAVPIQGFGSGALRRITVGSRNGEAGWLMRRFAVDAAETPEEHRAALGEFIQAVAASMPLIGASLGAPIVAALTALDVPHGTTVALLADGELAVTPLHAATLPDGTTLASRWDIVYAPSVAVLRLSARRGADVPAPGSALLVGDPTDTLQYAEVELEDLRRRLPGATRTLDEDLASEYAGEHLLHIACHGVHDWRAAGGSYLEMYPGRTTTSAEIARYRLDGCRLATLSACETGLHAFLQARDEFLGLPAAFLQAGAAAALCTLWRVDDLATSLFMHRFYDGLLSRGLTPARALREAAAWLRDHGDTYREPFFWAGFVLVGV
ncbi:CHAT domain-containing protein [Actinoplanes sp. NPDC051475]|uniref:CHAT domain-containing protein n=1 Tax=Actinoplanes sp. NPDC051475 TaxID=3157225 RepID=UPI00344C7932